MAIENGGVFEINVTVFHEPIKNVTRNAYNLVLELEYPKEYVLAPATFSYMFSDGTSGVFSKTLVYVELIALLLLFPSFPRL